MNYSHERLFYEEGSVERDFIDVVNNDIELIFSCEFFVQERNIKIVQFPSPETEDFYSVNDFCLRRFFKRRTNKCNGMSTFRDAGKYFMKMHFSAAAEWIPNILPVKNENVHTEITVLRQIRFVYEKRLLIRRIFSDIFLGDARFETFDLVFYIFISGTLSLHNTQHIKRFIKLLCFIIDIEKVSVRTVITG